MRDSFIFYRSFYEAIRELEPSDQTKIYEAISEYCLNFKSPELTGMSKAVWTLIKPQLDANNKRYKNGRKGGRPITKPKPKDNQTETKPKPNVNVNVNVNDNVNVNNNDNDNIEERKNAFWQKLFPFFDVYDNELLNNFFEYWTEHSEKGKKMRFEKEKVFDISLRLKTWARRSQDWSKGNKSVNLENW